MAITAADVKKLRDATGAGMMDAKKALTEADGDYEKAVELLRITGAAKAAKRADREVSNGLVAAAGHSLIQLGAETDFVAKNQEFIDLAEAIVEAVDAAQAETVEAAQAIKLAGGLTVEEAIAALAGKIGEKLELVNVAHFAGEVHAYLHRRSQDLPAQVGVLVEYEGASPEIVHHVALQVAMMNPVYVHAGEVPADVIETEKRLAEATAREEGKPEGAIPRIVEGRLAGFYKDVVLHEQEPVVPDVTESNIAKLLEKNGITVSRFVRFSAGPDAARR